MKKTGKKLLPAAIGAVLVVAASVLLVSNATLSDDRAKILFFGCDDADSILVQHGGQNLLIDTAEEEYCATLVEKLRDAGVVKLDYLVLTHPDKDHIGGAAEILHNFEVGEVYQSPYRKGSKTEEALFLTYTQKQIQPMEPQQQTPIQVGDLICTIYPPLSMESSNDASLIVLIQHGEVHALFTGDIQQAGIENALQLSLPVCDLYKVPHHGRGEASSAEIICVVSPACAVVTSKKADAEVVSALEDMDAVTLYTGNQDILLYSDGKYVFQ